jgi:hypothetical protein
MHCRSDFALLWLVAYYSHDRVANRQEVSDDLFVERTAADDGEDAGDLGFFAPPQMTP